MNKNAAGETGASAKVLGAEIEMSVPFYDLDPLGVVWHGNYYKYFELARAEFMKSIRFDIDEMRQSGYVWPVTKSDCSYISPLRYDMKIMVRAELQEEEHRLGLRYWITEKKRARFQPKTTPYRRLYSIDATGNVVLCTPDTLLSRIRDARNRRSL